MYTKLKGYLFIVLSAFSYSLMAVFVKLAGNELATVQIVFTRGVITLFLTYLIIRKKKVYPLGKNHIVLISRGLIGSVALYLVYESLYRFSLPEATVIQYLYPIFTALFASLLISEKISGLLYFSIFSGLVGVYIILDFPFLISNAISETNMMIALSGAILTGLSYVMVRKALTLKESPYVIMFYFPLFTVPMSLLFLPGNWEMPTMLIWIYLVLIGITSQLGQLFLTYGYELLPASRAAMTSYIQVPFSVIAGIIIFNDQITYNFIIGTLMIIFSIFLIMKKTKTH